MSADIIKQRCLVEVRPVELRSHEQHNNNTNTNSSIGNAKNISPDHRLNESGKGASKHVDYPTSNNGRIKEKNVRKGESGGNYRTRKEDDYSISNNRSKMKEGFGQGEKQGK